MVVLKVLAILAFGAATFWIVRDGYTGIARWWTRRLQAYASWMSVEFEAMALEMPVARAERLITAMIAGPFVVGLLLWGPLLGVILAVVGYFGGRAFVVYTRRRRLRMLDDQLVDALLMMANALKAGMNLRQALELVAREMRAPIADEFARMVKEIHLGRLTDEALARFAERVPLQDVRLVVDSILTLRETGGNLSDTFQVIAQTVVERKKIEGKIRAMTSQGMSQGAVVGAFPFVMLLVFVLLDPDVPHLMFGTLLGWLLIVLMVVLDALGVWLMFVLVKVDV